MNAKPHWKSGLAAKFGELRVNSKPPTGLLREKARPLLLKSESDPLNGLVKPSFVPHPPQAPKKTASVPSSPVRSQVIKNPTPPSTPKNRNISKRKLFKSEDLWDEDRVCGDGEACKADDIYSEKDIILERQPGDGCFSDIAEEDEECDEECVNDDDEVDEDNIEYECGDLDEEELGIKLYYCI
jgi:hypothetical protein